MKKPIFLVHGYWKEFSSSLLLPFWDPSLLWEKKSTMESKRSIIKRKEEKKIYHFYKSWEKNVNKWYFSFTFYGSSIFTDVNNIFFCHLLFFLKKPTLNLTHTHTHTFFSLSAVMFPRRYWFSLCVGSAQKKSLCFFFLTLFRETFLSLFFGEYFMCSWVSDCVMLF